MLYKPLFLEDKKEWGLVLLILILIFCITMSWRFYSFYSYISLDKQRFEARVLAQYCKNNKWVLKLKAQNGLILYTTSKENLKDLQNRTISIFGKPAKCTFYQSLRSCFFIAFSFDVLPKDWRSYFYEYVEFQHQEKLFSKLYQTLFFASNLPKEWRDLSSGLKISHLLAISGLHLGILAFVIYWLITPFYSFLQSRYFTYRNKLFDMGILVNIFLFGYLILLDFPPSFVRAYVMSVLGLAFVYFYFSLLSFSFLFLCVCLILALFPDFIFSLGFWFSSLGVFYIFLFFRYFNFQKISNPWIRSFVILCALNAVLFLHMLTWTHLFFSSFSLISILAIPLSIIFAPLFVLVLFLHLFGLGGVLDGLLSEVLKLDIESKDFLLPAWVGILYGISSLLAIKSRLIYVITLCFCLLLYCYIVFC